MTRTLISTIAWWLLAAALGLLLGGATSFAQLRLPDGLRSFADSNGGWTLLAFVVTAVCMRRPSARRWWIAAGMGLVVFHALLQGYAVVSTLRGFPDAYGPGDLYSVIATLAGPVLGVAGLGWASRSSTLRACGTAVVAAVMVGDGIWGLLRVAATTGWLYWTLSIAVGVGILAWAVVGRIDRPRDRVLAIALTGAGAALYALAFSAL
ncbi:hypothetical protein BFL35_10470 [Clavibacter michiganensis]|nr:hypothetical protein BFL35_10470 [Clavibacter michiganensis]